MADRMECEPLIWRKMVLVYLSANKGNALLQQFDFKIAIILTNSNIPDL